MSVQAAGWTETALWLAVVASGVYHGVNPGMGWPLAVSAGLMGRGRRDLIASLGPLGAGHFLAMAGVLLPFAAMTALVAWGDEIRAGAGLLVIAAGVYLLTNRRHPRFLARIKPTQLALWSFAVATAHGAGLMLLPIYLGICRAGEQDSGHQAAAALMRGNLSSAIAVSIVHATAMIVSGGIVALAVHEWLGLRFISMSWFNLDVVWASSLILVGAIGVSNAASAHGAADIQRRFAAYNADASESLSIRIGVHAGEPVEDHNDLFGATVQLAHRLCSEAEANGIVVSGLVRELSDEDAARFVALGERRLKGFAESTPVFRFEWRN